MLSNRENSFPSKQLLFSAPSNSRSPRKEGEDVKEEENKRREKDGS